MSGEKVLIPVPSEDPKKKKKQEDEAEQGKEGDTPSKSVTGKEAEKKVVDGKETEAEELSEEDQQLKNELEMLVERLKESNSSLYRPALETLRTLIRTSTSSMTSVPKPLKFLRPHYPDLQKLYEAWPASEDKSLFADILSVLAMTYSDTEPRGTLRYRLLSSSTTSKPSEPGSWGHEYIRHLAAELGDEFLVRVEREDTEATGAAAAQEEVGSLEDLRSLAMECATFLLAHNAEADAVDLLEELEIVHKLPQLVDENTFARVCTYMIRCVNLLPPPDDDLFLQTAHQLYLQHKRYPEALALSIRMGNPELVNKDFHAPGNPLMKRQLAFICARAGIPTDWVQPSSSGSEDMEDDDSEEEQLPQDLLECLTNAHLSENFRNFGKELGALDPKSLEDIYKSHLENTRTTTNVDSARANLAGSFVNAFVNAGFGNDKLMAEAEEGNAWVYKNKGDGMLSAAASLGLSHMWDLDVGLNAADRYSHSPEEFIKAGSLMATGILMCGIRTDEADTAYALLCEHVENKSVPMRTSAIIGLAIAYVGTHRQDILELLLPRVADETESMEIASLAALALGFTHVASCNGEINSTILEALMEREDSDLDSKWSRFMALGLALLYVGKQDKSDAAIETLKAIPHPVARQAQVLVESCSFAGTGNVLKIQYLLHTLSEHIEKKEAKDAKESDDLFQAFAVLGIALVAMGEDIGAEMSLRHFNHIMHYGEPNVRKMVPLALGLVSASNPQLGIMDTLSKYSHDNDLAVALNAILAMGFIGAGTNNARLGQMLRQLAGYYHKEPDCLFMVRIAQGLVHMGKGTMGINPFFFDRSIMSPSAVAGLLATLVAFSNAKGFILDKSHWMLFFLVPAMQPRFMITLNEELKNFPVTVRVGQAVDVVGQAGKPRTISGFQTHQTPVRLGTTERAEMATEEFLPFAPVLEGFVILQKNPGWESEDKMDL